MIGGQGVPLLYDAGLGYLSFACINTPGGTHESDVPLPTDFQK